MLSPDFLVAALLLVAVLGAKQHVDAQSCDAVATFGARLVSSHTAQPAGTEGTTACLYNISSTNVTHYSLQLSGLLNGSSATLYLQPSLGLSSIYALPVSADGSFNPSPSFKVPAASAPDGLFLLLTSFDNTTSGPSAEVATVTSCDSGAQPLYLFPANTYILSAATAYYSICEPAPAPTANQSLINYTFAVTDWTALPPSFPTLGFTALIDYPAPALGGAAYQVNITADGNVTVLFQALGASGDTSLFVPSTNAFLVPPDSPVLDITIDVPPGQNASSSLQAEVVLTWVPGVPSPPPPPFPPSPPSYGTYPSYPPPSPLSDRPSGSADITAGSPPPSIGPPPSPGNGAGSRPSAAAAVVTLAMALCGLVLLKSLV